MYTTHLHAFNLKAFIYAAIIFCLLMVNSSNAQPVLPSASNITWYTTANMIRGFNDVEFAYTGPSGATNTFVVSAYYDGGLVPTIHVRDLSVGVDATCASSGLMTSTPDVAIGNYYALNTTCNICTSTATDFILTVAYVNNVSQVEVDYYDIYDDGAGALSITGFGSPTLISGYTPQTVHIDNMANFYLGTMWSWAFPVCDQFAITWDDFTCTTPLVYVARCDVSTQTLSPVVLVGAGFGPDVSAIQKSGIAAVPDMHAFVTYVGAGGNKIDFGDYNFNTTTLTSSVLDNGSTSVGVKPPRIDAIDDYSINSNSTLTQYMVVALAGLGAGGTEVRNYSNLLSPGYNVSSNVIDISTVAGYGVAPPYLHYPPTVAIGWNWHYNVMHYMRYTAGVGNDIVFDEPYAISPAATLYGGNYYWVNGNGTPQNIDGANCNYANSVTGAINDQAQPMVHAWAWNNAGTATVDYKNPSSPYAFKHTKTTGTPLNTVKNIEGWQVFPNPTTDQISIKTPPATGTIMTYEIIDMTGKQVAKNDLRSSKENVDVSKLVPGTYMVKMYKNGIYDGQSNFVKK